LFDTSADSYLSGTVLVSVITVVERLRGYGLLSTGGPRARQHLFETEKPQYLRRIDNGAVEVVPLTAESGVIAAELIAATALASGLILVHNNPADFESLRAAIESHPERFLG
jgi:predicted nucleic acid-binding protein